MCRYAQTRYKSHYACFTCRKAFKQPSIHDYLAVRDRGYIYDQLQLVSGNAKALQRRETELGYTLGELREEYHRASQQCPECGEQMIDLGLDFKPPRQSDVRAWEAIQGLYRVGHVFHTCGCDGPGWIPRTARAYRDYLATRKTEYEHALKLVHSSRSLQPDERKNAAEYWSERIEAIDREQAAFDSTADLRHLRRFA